jgi:hypothetical protein
MMLMRSFLKDDRADPQTWCNEHHMAFLFDIFHCFLLPGILASFSPSHSITISRIMRIALPLIKFIPPLVTRLSIY